MDGAGDQRTAPPAPSEAESFLGELGIRYVKREDGTIVVPGELDISSRCFTALPDLTAVVVAGDFWCSNNLLTSLKGAPRFVGGDFHCSYNLLTSLAGAPPSVGGAFYCVANRLTSLKGAPAEIAKDFHCYDNELTDLASGPHKAGGDFLCNANHLISLRGAPEDVGGDFYCCRNPLEHLECAPRRFTTLTTDFGTFRRAEDIPEPLRFSPETRERLRLEAAERLERQARDATVLGKAITPPPPLRFKHRPR
jgi:hypothetical protein